MPAATAVRRTSTASSHPGVHRPAPIPFEPPYAAEVEKPKPKPGGRKRPRQATAAAAVGGVGVPRTWREVAALLATPNGGGKPRVKVLDTVFVDPNDRDGGGRPTSSAGGIHQQPHHPYAGSSPPPPLTLWVFTSKHGEPSRRKNVDSLGWSHVRERFGRFALANPANARGPRIVAACRGGGGDDGRGRHIFQHLTAEQFEREVKGSTGLGGSGGGGSGILGRCSSVQCYLRPLNGRDRVYRAAYHCRPPSSSSSSSDVVKPRVELLVVEDGTAAADETAAVLRLKDAAKLAGTGGGGGVGGGPTADETLAAGREAEAAVRAIAAHLEGAMRDAAVERDAFRNPAADPADPPAKDSFSQSGGENAGGPPPAIEAPRLASVSADFVLDDNKQLWLCHVSNVTAMENNGAVVSAGDDDAVVDDDRDLVASGGDEGPPDFDGGTGRMGGAESRDDVLEGNFSSHVHKQASKASSNRGNQPRSGGRENSPYQGEGYGPLKPVSNHDHSGSGRPDERGRRDESTTLSFDKRDAPRTPQHASPVTGGQAVSSAEQEYMERKGVDASRIPPTKVGLGGMDAEHHREVVNSLRERIAALEDGLRRERKKAAGFSQAAGGARKRAQELTRELANARKKHSRDALLKDAKHEHGTLDLGSQLNSSKAEIARLSALVAQLKGATGGGGGPNDGGPPSDAAKSLHEDLLGKIDALHRELTLSQRKWGEERRSLSSAHAAAEQSRAATHRAEMSEQRSVAAALEDEIAAQRERMRDAERERIVSLGKLEESAQREDARARDVERLESEIGLVRQSLEVARDADAAGTAAADPASSVDGSPKVQATADARIRTLNNKIEYLKAQLASEATVKEEYTATIARVRQEKEALTSAHRARLNEFEVRKGQQISQIQDKLRESVEKPMKEVSQLQAKLADLQSQLGRSMQSVAEARKQEEMARADVIKEQAHLNIANEELAASREECEAAQNELEHLKDTNIDAAVNEGVLRRLDNERRYLKNQLQNEVTCKAELLEKIDLAERDLREAKAAAKAEAEASEAIYKSAKDDRERDVAQLKGSNQVLEAEVKVQRGQLDEIREAYAKTRDQLRLEQASLEQIRSSGQRMAEELKAAQEELKHAREVNEAACERHNSNTKAISQNLKKVDTLRAQEIGKMQEETHRALQEASGVQREMLRIREAMSVQEEQSTKHLGAQMIASTLSRRFAVDTHRSFSLWRRETTVNRAVHQAREETASAVQSAEDRVRTECEEVTRNVVEKMRSVHEANVTEAESKLEEARRKDLKKAREDALKAVENERERSGLLLKEKETAWGKKEKDIHSHHQAAVARITIEHNLKLDNVHSRAQKKIDDALSEAEASLRERQEIIINDCNKRWEAKFREASGKHSEEKSIAVAEAKQEAARQLSAQTEKFAEEKIRAAEDMAEEVVREVQKETSRMEDKLTQALLDCEAKWKRRVHDAVEEYQREAQSADEQHRNDLDGKASQYDALLEEKVAQVTAELEQGHHTALKESLEQEQKRRFQAVKLEAAKWQQALREIETRTEVECRAHFEKGAQHREERAKKEIEELQLSANEALEKVKCSATENLKQVLEESERKLQLVSEKAEKEKQAEVATAVKKAMADNANEIKEAERKYTRLIEEERDRMQRRAQEDLDIVARNAAESERSAMRKLEAEVDSVRTEKTRDRDLFKSQMERLQKEAEDAMGRRLEEAERNSRRKQEVEREQANMEILQQRDELLQQHRNELEATKRESSSQVDILVQQVKQEAEEAMQRSLATLSSEHEKRVESMKEEVLSLREREDALNTGLDDMSQQVNNHQMMVANLEQDLKNESKQSSFRMLQLFALSATERERHRKSLQLKDQEISRELDAQKEEESAERQQLMQRLEKTEKLANSFREQHNAVYQTLVNHKRDALLQHKVKSRELSAQLEAIGSQRQELEEKQHKADVQMKRMEDGVRDAERQIQEHSQVSTIQGGRINVAHARRKRRLDEEYEQLLENIETKREQMTIVDERHKEILEKKEDLDSKMRSVERSLVEVLVEQQKKLLSLVSTKQHHVQR